MAFVTQKCPKTSLPGCPLLARSRPRSVSDGPLRANSGRSGTVKNILFATGHRHLLLDELINSYSKVKYPLYL
ncbi:hypothetical protein QVM86_14435 [Providencia stuartii]|uniref:hypothetical protein n=1 Tax=Morganellaceae TaxID=1903414 RepID=UPI0025AAD401|nr:hypothetical protein [Providencia stuartii]MDN0020307.1 hypothetical protein [Providencia stuartii]